MIPEWEVAVKITTFIPIILFGILGNIMLLNVIIRNRSLQTPTNLLLANMAVADFFVLTICSIMFLFKDFYQNFILGAIGCKMEGYVQGALLMTAVFNLCAVTYERLTAIVLPMETRLTIFSCKIVMACAWVGGFTLAVPLAVYRTYKEREWKNFVETFCMENTTVLPTYWHVLIATIVWFPLCAMIICYSAIFWKLDRYEAKVLKRENPICVSYKTKVARTLFIVVVTFLVLRLPFTTLVFIRNNWLKKSQMNQAAGFESFSYASQYLIYVNAAINPVIYGLTNDTFKRAYHQTPMLACLSKPKAHQANDVFSKKRNESSIWFWIASKHRWGQGFDNSKATITTKIKIISNLAEAENSGSGHSDLNSNVKQTSTAVI
ncbi:hypothetical protein HA402_014168 [Bradysia odoriphaga]|nr:hypothetical protein HA402_014168 [Bradysia odoriphaga]